MQLGWLSPEATQQECHVASVVVSLLCTLECHRAWVRKGGMGTLMEGECTHVRSEESDGGSVTEKQLGTVGKHLIPALCKTRQEDCCELKVSWCYVVSSRLA